MKSDVLKKVPRHIGIIMDGNGRWAKNCSRSRIAGHKAGVKNIMPVVKAALDAGVECVTLYAFSTENRNRDRKEINALIDLIRKHLKTMTRDLISRGARVVFSGDTTYFPDDVQAIMAEIAAENAGAVRNTVNIALDYGAREEIVRAANRAAANGEVTRESFEKELYTAGLPELDMIIRTGGEQRLSNFLLYQAAYAELFFTDTLWPDFDVDELMSLIDKFNQRTRKFGK